MFLVTGATGNVGGELVRALADAGEGVRALTRGPAAGDFARTVETVTGDLNEAESLRPALAGVRGVFLLPGYADMPAILAEIEKAGVEHVVLLSGSSAASGDMTNAISAYMISSEAAVTESGIPWTILRPSGFMSNALRWIPQLQAGEVIREPFADAPVAVIDPADIAAVAAAVLRSPATHKGRTYRLSGPESLLPADRLRILGQVLGRELRLEAQTEDEARRQMSREMPAPYVEAFFDFYVDGALDESPVHATVQQILDRPARTFVEWARAHERAFR
jgi:uncharacterized protein YbjT (DUF2867 family)